MSDSWYSQVKCKNLKIQHLSHLEGDRMKMTQIDLIDGSFNIYISNKRQDREPCIRSNHPINIYCNSTYLFDFVFCISF